MHEFKHPKYYKELRKRNKSDQSISLREDSTEPGERSTGPGHKQQASSVQQASDKLQATSNKRNSRILRIKLKYII
jgi:hypothetical protein